MIETPSKDKTPDSDSSYRKRRESELHCGSENRFVGLEYYVAAVVLADASLARIPLHPCFSATAEEANHDTGLYTNRFDERIFMVPKIVSRFDQFDRVTSRRVAQQLLMSVSSRLFN